MSKKKILCYVLLTAMLVSMFATGEVSVAAGTTEAGIFQSCRCKVTKRSKECPFVSGNSAKTADAWLKDVVSYNKTIKNTSLVKKASKRWEKSHRYIMKTGSVSSG